MIVDRNRRISAVNPKCCELIGYTENELVGSSAEIMHLNRESYLEFGKKAFAQVRQNSPVNLDWSYKKKDGSIIWLRVAGDTVEGADEVLWTNVDITKRIEAQLEVKKRKSELENLAAQLSKYLSPQIYDSIFTGRKAVKIEAHRKKLTVFFSDIKGFTELTDRLEPEVLSSLLNNYLTEMSKIALKHGGTIDKFVGDAILIFYGDPESRGDKEDALSCVQMAIEMREKMILLRKKWDNQGIFDPLRIRIGVNTGHCNVGNFGSESRLDYTIIGGEVNLASRLESSANDDQILISHETYALIRDKIACKKLEKIKVKGIAHSIQTYQVIDQHDNLLINQNELKEEHDGFSLSVDLERADKAKAIASLRKALESIE